METWLKMVKTAGEIAGSDIRKLMQSEVPLPPYAGRNPPYPNMILAVSVARIRLKKCVTTCI
ncbi:hypothetical protein [Aliiroseovarius crassostreae]|uniref:hypothetical protein n=1 Tax=Aliiroseovarius crassostreae TaxID=154981 RepID=UPI003C7CBC63